MRLNVSVIVFLPPLVLVSLDNKDCDIWAFCAAIAPVIVGVCVISDIVPARTLGVAIGGGLYAGVDAPATTGLSFVSAGIVPTACGGASCEIGVGAGTVASALFPRSRFSSVKRDTCSWVTARGTLGAAVIVLNPPIGTLPADKTCALPFEPIR